jgi:Lrp/AsnC family transcriptional regulator for asnA, asnC and gidA
MRHMAADVPSSPLLLASEEEGLVRQNLLRRWPLSSTDRAIIGHLQEDGRRSFVTIARDLQLSEKTVRTRVHHLLESHVIQIVALTSPAALGYRAAALAGLTTDPRVPASQIAVALREIPDLDYVIVTAGRYNVLAEIISHDLSSMQTVIEQEIGKIGGIQSLELFPYFSIYYQNARFFRGGHSGGSDKAVMDDELDEIDKRIVLELNHDGRAPLKLVAERLGVSESQIRTRIGNMIDAGKMNIMAIVNPMNVAGHATAYVGIRAATGCSLVTLGKDLAAVPQVSYVTLCSGRFDVFAEVVCSSKEELLEAIDFGIRNLSGVARVETFIYVDLHYKRLVPIRG